jgi:hypothetical protein
LDDATLLFADPPPGERFLRAETTGQLGGWLGVRRLRASAALAPYLRATGWWEAGLVLEVEAVVRWPRQPEHPVRRETCRGRCAGTGTSRTGCTDRAT